MMVAISQPRALVLTISDSASIGQRVDLSGPAAQEELDRLGCVVEGIEILPDDYEAIRGALTRHADRMEIDVIVTTGGTGLSPRDVTPEATAAVIEKLVPGMAEWMRLQGAKHNPRAALSRALVGIRKKTLIINLPGSVKGVRESLHSLSDLLPHALEVLSGKMVRCGG